MELLLSASREFRYRDPRRMVQVAELARMAADRLALHPRGGAAVADTRALAWIELANAHRVARDLPRAERAMKRALVLQQRGSGDPLLLARAADVTASLCCDQRRFAAAFEILEAARRIYHERQDDHLAGRALITMSHFAACDGEPRLALCLVIKGLTRIDPSRDPALAAIALKNLIVYLVDCGQLTRARKLLWRANVARALPDDPLSRLRLRWVEGRIEAGLGRPENAERCFLAARQGFEELELGYDAGLVSLDLAVTWLRQGRGLEVQRLVRQVYEVFAALQIDREAVAAVYLLVEACEQEKATAELIGAVTEFLNELERRPGLRFKP